jgi:hypothetical protein
MVPHGDLGDWRVVAGEPNASPDFDKSYPWVLHQRSPAPISEVGRGPQWLTALIGARLPPDRETLTPDGRLELRQTQATVLYGSVASSGLQLGI